MIRTEVDDLRDILNKYPEAYAKILDDGDIYDNEELYNELFEYCMEDMPYGTQKARDGDPVQWITEHLDYLGLLTKEQTDAQRQKDQIQPRRAYGTVGQGDWLNGGTDQNSTGNYQRTKDIKNSRTETFIRKDNE